MGDQNNRYRSWASKLTVVLGFLVIISMAISPLRTILGNTRTTGNVQEYVNISGTTPDQPNQPIEGVSTLPSAPGVETPTNTTTAISPDGAYGVSSSNRIAADIAMEVMAQGGNAADAAAAAALVLSVVEPHASGLGGAGAALVYTPENEKVTQIMYRERSSKNPDNLRKKTGVPGLAKGLEYLIGTFGTVDEDKLIEPARQLAANGFNMDSTLFDIWKRYGFGKFLDQNANDLFFPNGVMQTFVKQPEYAETLQYLQENGLKSFYEEPFAKDLAELVPGLETEDITSYTMYVDEAVKGTFQGWDVYTASPPMSGITFLQMLNMMEYVDLKNYSVDSTEYYHYIADITNLAYRSRFLELADPTTDFIDTAALAGKPYSEGLASQIVPGIKTELDKEQYVPNQDQNINPNDPAATTPAGTTGMLDSIPTYVNKEESHTTHLVVVDKTGMMVSMTNTIGTFFGTGRFPKGFFVNNLLTNFNDYDENPGYWGVDKSPRSFITPSLMMKDGKVLGLGSPGGARIPSMLAQGVANYVYYDLPLSDAMERYRIFADKNVIKSERSLNPQVTQDLNQMGYSIRVNDDSVYFGGIQALLFDPYTKTVEGAADSRRGGVWRTSETELEEETNE